MPAPIITAGLIAAGSNLLGQGINAYAQGKTNKATRRWNEKMYGIQRQDALADWQMQNAYNSPAAQMERLRAAGLNPNLVYGHGADAQGGIIRSTDVKGWNPQAPQFDFGSVSGQYFNTMLMGQQYEKTQQLMTMMEQELKNKMADWDKTQAEIAGILASNDLKSKDKEWYDTIKSAQMTALKADVEKKHADIYTSLAANERAEAMQAYNLEQAVENILKTRADRHLSYANRQKVFQEIENMKKQGTLQDWEIELSKKGLTKGDPYWMRAIKEIVDEVSAGGSVKGALQKLDKMLPPLPQFDKRSGYQIK